MNYIHLCSAFILSSTLSTGLAQLPFFLQRFRPIRHGLMASGSSPYSSSLLSPTTSSFSFSPPQHNSLASLLLQQSAAASTPSLFGSYPSSSALFSPASFGGSNGHHLRFSPSSSSFGTSSSSNSGHHLGFSPSSSSNSHHFGFSPPSGFGTSFSSSNNGHHLESSALSQLYQQQHNNPLGSSWTDLGTSGAFDGGLGGYDHAELLEDYPGFSSAGFAKELNFAGSQPVRFQSPSSNPYSGLQFYLQRSA